MRWRELIAGLLATTTAAELSAAERNKIYRLADPRVGSWGREPLSSSRMSHRSPI
jgi:hypothetical protein